jgi:hypothetical protein
MHAEVWLIMIRRLREFPGRAWVTSTPRGFNWLYETFFSLVAELLDRGSAPARQAAADDRNANGTFNSFAKLFRRLLPPRA